MNVNVNFTKDLPSYSLQLVRALVHSMLKQAISKMLYKGGCYCGKIKYTINASPDDLRTSLCHCLNCKKFFGTPFGLTTKVPLPAFAYTQDSIKPTIHEADNGSGVQLHREFCGTCGSGILEVGQGAMDKFRYVMTGTLDDMSALPPKGEFWCRRREKWMPEIKDIFHKQEVQE